MNFHRNHIQTTKSCLWENVTVRLEVRVKIFEMTLEFKICFWKLVWVRGYPQKQTGWSYDAWIHFYCIKRAEVAIFWISKLSEGHLGGLLSKKCSFERFLEITFRKEWWIYCVLCVWLSSTKFLRGSLSPKLSKNMRGVIANRMNPFLITQTCGASDFFIIFNNFEKNGC